MTLRFTDTNKWTDPWFRKLPPWGKNLWSFLCDNVDVAGVWQVDTELCDMLIGMPLPWPMVPGVMGDRVRVLSAEKWLLPKFVAFQFRKGINPGDPFGKSVLICLSRHGLTPESVGSFIIQKEGPREGLPRGYLAPQDKTGQDNPRKGNGQGEERTPAGALRGAGLSAAPDAVAEWEALARDTAGCVGNEAVCEFIAWSVTKSRFDGLAMRYSKDAGGYAVQWANNHREAPAAKRKPATPAMTGDELAARRAAAAEMLARTRRA